MRDGAIYIYIHIHIYIIYTYTHTYTYIYTYIYVYVYIHTYTYTYMYMYVYVWNRAGAWGWRILFQDQQFQTRIASVKWAYYLSRKLTGRAKMKLGLLISSLYFFKAQRGIMNLNIGFHISWWNINDNHLSWIILGLCFLLCSKIEISTGQTCN